MDRSGLVAQYAGQTGPKTNKKIDESLDGMLFIDEAYSLVADADEDAYGHEAVQTLLKRMEDDRQRLVVILAGYPEPMSTLLRSNPGFFRGSARHWLSTITGPVNWGAFFKPCATKADIKCRAQTQAKLLVGFRWLYEQRDEHFGNGRLARNVFEQAIRRLANRISRIAPVTERAAYRDSAEGHRNGRCAD